VLFTIERHHPKRSRFPCPGSSGVEQWIENPRVGGSIPPLGTTCLKPRFFGAFLCLIKYDLYDSINSNLSTSFLEPKLIMIVRSLPFNEISCYLNLLVLNRLVLKGLKK
jgi:hypothetical protein